MCKDTMKSLRERDIRVFKTHIKKIDDADLNKLIVSLDGYSQKKTKDFLRKYAIQSFNQIGENMYDDWKNRK